MEEAVEEKKIESEDTPSSPEPKKTDIEDLAKVEVTKATISQAVGTLLYPITSEIAAAEVKGINKLKEFLKSRNKQKLAERNKRKLEEAVKEAESNPEKLRTIEKIHDLMETASEQELENDDLVELWSSLIDRIRAGDSDTDLLVSKLESLTTAEAEFLIEFYAGKHKYINVNNFLSAISFKSKSHPKYERSQELAISLKNKGLITQPFPVLRAIFGALFPILFFLLFAEFYRDMFSEMSINVSSANNVILLGVFGVMIGFSFLPFLRQRTRLTWLGEKLCDGIKISEKRKT